MINKLYHGYILKRQWNNDIASIKKQIKQAQTATLPASQKRDAEAYYQKLIGRKIPTYWHEYLSARHEAFSVKFVPACVYHTMVIYRLNHYALRHAYVDKGAYDIFFPDVNRPRTIVKKMNGYFYDNQNSITEEEALERCRNLDSVVIKPTFGTWGGGVKMISVNEGMVDEKTSVKSLFDSYKDYYIVQERVQQHEQMSQLNPTSLNTLRVMTYRDGNDVFVLYMVVRIGRMGECVDNETAGGIKADVDLSTGTILECAYGNYKEPKMYQTDSGAVLKGYQIPAFEKVIAFVKQLHTRLPYFNLIGWDIAVDAAGEPILIEWNRCPDLSQVAHGPAFGEMTEEIFKRVMSLPDSRYFGFGS